MSKGHDLPEMHNDGHVTLEMMIPGNKAGIVIGKGGETIKILQVSQLYVLIASFQSHIHYTN